MPVKPRKILVIGCGGQLGRALQTAYEGVSHVEYVDLPEFDLTSADFVSARSWREYDTIVNAAAFTAVDVAETPRKGGPLPGPPTSPVSPIWHGRGGAPADRCTRVDGLCVRRHRDPALSRR